MNWPFVAVGVWSTILSATPTAHLSHLVNSWCTIFTVQQQIKSTDHLSQLGCSIKYSVQPQLLIYHTWTIYHSWGAVYNTQCNPNCLFITLGIFYGLSVVYNNSVQLQMLVYQCSINLLFSTKKKLIIDHSPGMVYYTEHGSSCSFITLGGLPPDKYTVLVQLFTYLTW